MIFSWAIQFFSQFFHILVMVAPYFILGIGVGAFLETKANLNMVYNALKKGPISIIYASIFGAILPGCACATMPMAEGLIRRGASVSTAAAFTLTSPLLAPQTLILTQALLGTKFAIGRLFFGLLGGISIGFIVLFFERKNALQIPLETATPNCCTTPPSKPTFLRSFFSISKKLGGYLVIGLAIATLLNMIVPPNLIPETIGKYPWAAYLLASLIGIPIYICEGEEIPITLSLITLGLAQGPAFSFLLGAVGTCIPTMIFAQKILGKKAVLIYGLFWCFFAPFSGVLFSAFTM
jgi:uncharacterized membrane protein YraQ (UPF0718 family)